MTMTMTRGFSEGGIDTSRTYDEKTTLDRHNKQTEKKEVVDDE